MRKRNNYFIISAVLVAFLAGTIFSSPNYALALPPWANDMLVRIGILETTTHSLQTISLSGNDLTLSDGGGTVTLSTGGGADRIILVFSSGTDDGRDRYIGLGFITGFEDQASVIVPVGGEISKVWCKAADAPGTGIDEFAFDLWVNGVERKTDICKLVGTDNIEEGTVSEIISAGDRVSIFVDNTGGAASKGMSAGLIISTT